MAAEVAETGEAAKEPAAQVAAQLLEAKMLLATEEHERAERLRALAAVADVEVQALGVALVGGARSAACTPSELREASFEQDVYSDYHNDDLGGKAAHDEAIPSPTSVLHALGGFSPVMPAMKANTFLPIFGLPPPASMPSPEAVGGRAGGGRTGGRGGGGRGGRGGIGCD